MQTCAKWVWEGSMKCGQWGRKGTQYVNFTGIIYGRGFKFFSWWAIITDLWFSNHGFWHCGAKDLLTKLCELGKPCNTLISSCQIRCATNISSSENWKISDAVFVFRMKWQTELSWSKIITRTRRLGNNTFDQQINLEEMEQMTLKHQKQLKDYEKLCAQIGFDRKLIPRWRKFFGPLQ